MSSPPQSRRLPHRLLAGLALPVIAFLVLLKLIGNATGALAVTEAFPVAWVVGYAIWRRKVEPIGLFVVVGFALALGLTFVFGGRPLPLELRRSWFPGVVGLACLISLALRRPLLLAAADKVGGAHREEAAGAGRDLDSPGARRTLSTLTAIIGVTGTADAVAQITLALTVSTTQFVVLARIASYTIIGSGIAVGALYVRHVRARLARGRHQPQPPSGVV